MKGKLKSFTLFELLITMLLISVVMLIAINSFGFVTKYFKLIQTNRELDAECISFRQILKRDFELADSLKWEEKNLLVYQGVNTNKWLSLDSVLIRKDEKLDIQVDKIFQLENTVLAIRKLNKKGLVTDLEVIIAEGEANEQSFRFYKKYPISSLIN